MQFSVVALLVAFAASAYAVPTGIQHSRRGCDIASKPHLRSIYLAGYINGSHLIECALALGPTAVSCVSAAVQAGVGMYHFFPPSVYPS
jgi:hypothetical protein